MTRLSTKTRLAAFGGPQAVPAQSIVAWPAADASHLEWLHQVVRSGRYHRVNHPIVEQLEIEAANWSRMRSSRALSSGTAALHVAVDFYKHRGGRVLLAALNWPGAAGPIQICDLEPVFVDIDPVNACMSDALAAERVGDDLAALLVTHLFGNFCPLRSTRRAAAARDIPIIDDCAQAISAPQHLGSGPEGRSDAVVFSGNGSKHLGAGELGLLCSDHPDLIDHVDMVSLSSSARNADREFSPLTYGYNYRPNIFSAAIALNRLPAMTEQVEARKHNVEMLMARLRSLPGLHFLFDEQEAGNCFCSLALRLEPGEIDLPASSSARDYIVELLFAEGVPAGVWLKKPVWEYLPKWRGRFDLADFPNTRQALETMFYVPQIAPPNDSRQMSAIADAFEKVWDAMDEIRSRLRRTESQVPTKRAS